MNVWHWQLKIISDNHPVVSASSYFCHSHSVSDSGSLSGVTMGCVDQFNFLRYLMTLQIL